MTEIARVTQASNAVPQPHTFDTPPPPRSWTPAMAPPSVISDPMAQSEWTTVPLPSQTVTTAPQPEMPPPPVVVQASEIEVEAEVEVERSTPHTFSEFEMANTSINKVEVLSNRVVPGTDGALEHVILANHQVTIVRSAPAKGRVRVTRDDVFVGGVSCKVLLTGLEARVDTVRHIVGGDAFVYGALFLAKHQEAPLQKVGTIMVGPPRAVIESLIEGHCAAEPSPYLAPLAAELDGIFLPIEKLGG